LAALAKLTLHPTICSGRTSPLVPVANLWSASELGYLSASPLSVILHPGDYLTGSLYPGSAAIWNPVGSARPLSPLPLNGF